MVVFSLKIMKIPTRMGGHSCKCTELSLKQKERITSCVQFYSNDLLSGLYCTVIHVCIGSHQAKMFYCTSIIHFCVVCRRWQK